MQSTNGPLPLRFRSHLSSQRKRADRDWLPGKRPAIDVVRWLEANWTEPTGDESEYALISGDERRLLEFILGRRGELLIDWGLARFGCSPKVVQSVFGRGNAATRIAAAANPRGAISPPQRGNILRQDKWPILRALLQNAHLPGEFFTNFLTRKEGFADISDDRFRLVLQAISGNKRFRRPYDERHMNGYAEYLYAQVGQAAWDLVKTVPVTQSWAATLERFLIDCERLYQLDGLDSALARWGIDDPNKDSANPSFYLRSLIADYLNADDTLLLAGDLALRMSFYRRFLPQKFPNWSDFLERDGEEFVRSALENPHLWRSEGERAKLRQVCWAAPDPKSYMNMPNSFRAREDRYRKTDPAWFAAPGVGPYASTKQALFEIQRNLTDLRETVDRKTRAGTNTEPARQRWSNRVPWWIWLGIGAALTYLFRQLTL